MTIQPTAGGPAAAGARGGRAKPLSFHDCAVAIGISLGLTLFGAVYLGVFRRTYLFNAPPHVDAFYVPNKVIIGTGILMLAFTFLIGLGYYPKLTLPLAE